jgi:hypothetical protein
MIRETKLEEATSFVSLNVLEIKNPTIRNVVSWESSRRRREVNVRNRKEIANNNNL